MPSSYENFVDTILYGRDSIFVRDLNDAMQFKELKRKVPGSKEDGAKVRLIVSRGRNKKKDGGNKGKSRSKSRHGRL